jgi:hypothetical protein
VPYVVCVAGFAYITVFNVQGFEACALQAATPQGSCGAKLLVPWWNPSHRIPVCEGKQHFSFLSPPPLFLLTYLHTFLPSFIIPQSLSFSCNQFHMSFEPYGLGFCLLRLESAPKIHYMISFLCSLLHFTVSGLKSWSVFLCSVQPTEYWFGSNGSSNKEEEEEGGLQHLMI